MYQYWDQNELLECYNDKLLFLTNVCYQGLWKNNRREKFGDFIHTKHNKKKKVAFGVHVSIVNKWF